MITYYIDHSSLTDEIKFDAFNNSMSIHFLDTDTTWVYYDIPDDVLVGLLTSNSMGEYFNLYVRNNYKCEKVTPP